jgi:hypothetical protein
MEKKEQAKLLTEIMQADENNGLYDTDISKMEITQKQINMKLYTEEQVKGMIDDAHNGIDGYYDIFKKHTPIKLPSDEEIEKMLGSNVHDYYKGAKWMRDKILNQNK